jgi:membrane-anchored protein YejM (alkaline phosphatase superfamily)
LRAEIASILGPNVVAISARNTKFANFARLYFPHFTTFRNQTFQFTNFSVLFLAVVIYLHLLA